MVNQLTGFNTSFTGVLRKVTAEPKANADKSKTWVENSMHLEYEDHRGVPAMATIRLPKAFIDAGNFQKLNSLQGKLLTFFVSSVQRVWNNSIYTDYYLRGSDLPSVLEVK